MFTRNENENRCHNKRWHFLKLGFIAVVFVLGAVVMYLWNAILPDVIGVHSITYWQAMGILVLSKILFGGFHGRRGFHHHDDHRKEMRDKWLAMTPEERENAKKDWWHRFKSPSSQE